MKIKNGYILREVAHQAVVVPIGEAALNFNGVITLNKTGAFLWKLLENETNEKTLIEQLLSHYKVTTEAAEKDVNAFLNKMKEHGLLE